MTAPREIEIKLDADPVQVDTLNARLVEELGPPSETQTLRSVYFDTPSRVLHGHGLTLRVRSVGGRYVQTVKRGNEPAGGLFQRDEWETEIAEPRPDLQAARKTPVAALLKHAHESLAPAFETAIERRVWSIDRDGSSIEIAFDSGHVTAGDAAAPLAELELELKSGAPAPLFGVMRDLAGLGDLQLGVQPKAERGYALLTRKKTKARKAEPVNLKPGLSTAMAFQRVLHGCLRQFRLNEPLVVSTRDPDALHQARVGMRRLRSALSLFKPVVRDEGYDRLAERLRTVSRELGDARNLDVYLLGAVTTHADRSGADPGTAAYRAEVEARRKAAYDHVIETLSGGAFRGLMLDLLAWIEGGPWLVSDDPLRRALRDQPIESFAAAVLDERRRKVKKKGRHIERLDPHARHRVRIAAKKLRYAAEFFATLATRRKEQGRHAAFLDAMEALQADLGDLNDIQTGHDLAAGLSNGEQHDVDDPVPAAFSAGQLTAEADARAAQLLKGAGHHYAAFKATKPFWSRWH